MQKLVKQIVEEQQKIDEQLDQENPKLDFYKEFFKKYYITSAYDVLNIDTCDLIVALIAKEESSQPIEKVKDVVYSNRNFFENISTDSTRKLMETILVMDSAGVLKAVIENLKAGVMPSPEDKGQREIRRTVKDFILLAESIDTSPKDFAKIMEFIIEDMFICFKNEQLEPTRDLSFFGAIIYANALRDFEQDLQKNQEQIDSFLDKNPNKKIRSKNRIKLMRDLAKADGWNLDAIVSEVSMLRHLFDELTLKESSRRKKLNKTKQSYETLSTHMFGETNRHDRQIRIPEKELSKIPSAAVKNSALRVIYEHNLDLCKKKEAEYSEVAANATTSYQLLLANYGISPTEYEVGTILHQTLPDIETMLKRLTSVHITDPNLLLSIIQVSDLETTNNFVSLTEKGIVTSNLFQNHPSLFNPRSKEYENIMRNLATIKHHGINPHYFTTSEEVLITPSKTFSHNIDTLDDYQLTSSIKKGMNTSFLTEPDLTSAIDTLLELGYEKNLEASPELLNYRDKFARLRILKELNIPVTSTEELLNVLTTNKFYVPDSMIKNYIYNAVDYNLPENITLLETPKKKPNDMARLEDFSKTPRTYDFDGITISKNRVTRNLNEVKPNGNVDDRLVYSILKGATLNDEEVAKIKSTLGASKAVAPIKQKS